MGFQNKKNMSGKDVLRLLLISYGFAVTLR